MSNWKIEAGKAVWAAGKKFFRSKKGDVETISAVRPGTKFKGQKTVQEQKNLTSQKQFKSAMEEFGARITGNLKKSAKKLDKLNKTLKKQKKISDE